MEKNKKGFTLIELIVVIAILVILAALALPQYGKMKDESNRVVCNSNIEVLTRAYLAEIAIHPNESSAEAYANVKDENPSAKCPLDNEYTVSYADNGGITITCPKHGNKSVGGIDIETGRVSAEIKDNYAGLLDDIFGKDVAQLTEYFKALGYDVPPFTYVSNDNILKYLYNDIYGGTWPEMSKDFYKDMGLKVGDKQLYIRPYATASEFSDSSKVYAFASESNSATSPWSAHMVYIDGTWYKNKDGKGFSLGGNNSTYEAMKDRIINGELVPAK